MKIVSYGCKNYKPFRQNAVIDVRPLTLIFGKNNSGKSALLRMVRLILRALSARMRGDFPLEVDELTFGVRFQDLIHRRLPQGSASFQIMLEVQGETLDLSVTVQNYTGVLPNGEEGETSVVSDFTIGSPVQRRLKWNLSQGLSAPRYDGDEGGSLSFRGFLPETMNIVGKDLTIGDASIGPTGTDRWRFVDDWRDRVQALEDLIEHLGPSRAVMTRVHELGARRPLGFEGEGAPSRLARDVELLTRTSAWYREHLDGWRLSVDKTSSGFECTVNSDGVTVNLVDAGQGMQEVLPVVVQQLSHQIADGGSFIDLVEQPELHLHTAAQAPLGDLFLETAKTGRGQVIVETHSENLLLRIRRRIAEGVNPDLVAVYWIEDHPEGHSTVRRINIDQDGELDWWREGIFSEGYDEVKAMRRAVRARQEKGHTQHEGGVQGGCCLLCPGLDTSRPHHPPDRGWRP